MVSFANVAAGVAALAASIILASDIVSDLIMFESVHDAASEEVFIFMFLSPANAALDAAKVIAETSRADFK